jgi:hypothetical protein
MSKTTGNVMDPLEVNSAVIECALPFPWLLHSCGPNLLRVLSMLTASLLVLTAVACCAKRCACINCVMWLSVPTVTLLLNVVLAFSLRCVSWLSSSTGARRAAGVVLHTPTVTVALFSVIQTQ